MAHVSRVLSTKSVSPVVSISTWTVDPFGWYSESKKEHNHCMETRKLTFAVKLSELGAHALECLEWNQCFSK